MPFLKFGNPKRKTHKFLKINDPSKIFKKYSFGTKKVKK
jgi:hypothetical protein